MKESSEKKTRRIMTGLSRKAGGVSKIPAEFLPSGQMKVIRGQKFKPTVKVTEESKRLWLEINKLRYKLDRILGKLTMGLEVTEIEKKRIPFLKARIEHLKKKLSLERGTL